MSGMTEPFKMKVDKRTRKFFKKLGLHVVINVIDITESRVVLQPKVVDRKENDVWVYTPVSMMKSDTLVLSGLDIQFSGESIVVKF